MGRRGEGRVDGVWGDKKGLCKGEGDEEGWIWEVGLDRRGGL